MKCRCSSGGGGGRQEKKGTKPRGRGKREKLRAGRFRLQPTGREVLRAGAPPSRDSALCRFGPQREPQPRRGGPSAAAQGGAGEAGTSTPAAKRSTAERTPPPTRPLPVFKPLRVRWKTNKCHRRRYAAAEEGAASGKEERVTRAPKEELRRTVLHRFRARPEHGRWRYPTCRPYVRCKHRHVAEGQAEGKTAPPKFTGQLGEAIAACSKPESRDIKVPD